MDCLTHTGEKKDRDTCHQVGGIYTIRFNWALLLAGAAFYVYGLYSAPLGLSAKTLERAVINSVLDVLTAGLFVFFLWVGVTKQARHLFEMEIALGKRDFLNALVYLVTLLLFVWHDLRVPLVGDEIFHVQDAFRHSYGSILKLGSVLPAAVQSISGWIVLWGVNFTYACVVFVAIRRLFLCSTKTLCVISFVLFISARIIVRSAGVGDMVHPPLRLLPLWFSGLILSPSVFAFRFAPVLALVVMLCFVERSVRGRFGGTLSLLFGLAVGTVPCLLATTVIVESSIWTALLWTIIVLAIASRSIDYLCSPKFLVSAISATALATLMRQSAFLALIPLSVLVGMHCCRTRACLSLKTVALLLSPTLLFLPTLAKGVYYGTPATYILGEFGVLEKDLGALERVASAISIGVFQDAAANALYPWGVVLVLVAFLPFGRRHVLETLLFCTLLLAAVYIFFSIRPILWGTPRYQAEYLTAFVVAGLFRIVDLAIPIFKKRSVCICGALLVTVCCANVYAYKQMPNDNMPVDDRLASNLPYWKWKGLSECFFDYRSAYRAAREIGASDGLYVIGVTYGVFSGILYHETLHSLVLQNAIAMDYAKYTDGELAVALYEDKRVRMVFIVDRGGRTLADCFRASRWLLWRTFVDKKNGSTIYAFRRRS